MENDAASAGGFWPYETAFSRWFERLQGNAPDVADAAAASDGAAGDAVVASASFIGSILNGLLWIIGTIIEAFYNIIYAVFHPADWLAWVPHINGPMADAEVKASLMRFIYYGASLELFFALLLIFLIVSAFAFAYRPFMWGIVRFLEGLANGIGRPMAWAGLLMVMVQIMIVFMQRVFAVSEISLGFGVAMSYDVSWWAESLKFYNAIIVCLCVTYTFVQGGHVRVDLVYSAVSHRAQRIIDMIGSMVFMIPAAIVVWLYGWFFMWRHLVVPNPSASDTLERLLMKARALRWNIETIGFSPNGFDAYFLFKVLLVTFTFLVILQAIAFFYRSYLELVEGEESVGKYLDKDSLNEGEETHEGAF